MPNLGAIFYTELSLIGCTMLLSLQTDLEFLRLSSCPYANCYSRCYFQSCVTRPFFPFIFGHFPCPSHSRLYFSQDTNLPPRIQIVLFGLKWEISILHFQKSSEYYSNCIWHKHKQYNYQTLYQRFTFDHVILYTYKWPNTWSVWHCPS